MPRNTVSEMKWVGGIYSFIDKPTVELVGSIVLGTYGGNSDAGANKNEDGALLWSNDEMDWEFAVILDGHNSSESVQLLVDAFMCYKIDIIEILTSSPLPDAFERLQKYAVNILSTVDTSSIRGESSCLVFARRGRYLWWLNVGDCTLYLLHEDYSRLGQYAVNQRSFFEWVGQVNTFDELVPCYSAGVKLLRKGRNVILAVTDGVLEFGERPFEDPKVLYDTMFSSEDIRNQVRDVLEVVHSSLGSDSATIIAWSLICDDVGPVPSNA